MVPGSSWGSRMRYAHDHLYSPVALIEFGGTLRERYEYDAYGNCYVLEPNFAPDPDGKSDYENPYKFTGRRVDILDNGSLKIQYNRNRYYDYYTGRWLTHDPLGITPNPQKLNKFGTFGQYTDGLSLYESGSSNPISRSDPWGLVSSGEYIPWRGLFDIRIRDDIQNRHDIGSLARIDFRPFLNAQACCDEITLGQIVQTGETYKYRKAVFWWRSRTIFHDWHVDKSFPLVEAEPWIKGRVYPLQAVATLHDFPGDDNTWEFRVIALSQAFETCAICMGGTEKGANYGCVKWGHLLRQSPSGGYSVTRWAFTSWDAGILHGAPSSRIEIEWQYPTEPSVFFHGLIDSLIP